MSDSLALSDVLARGVSLEWHEAVAVVREVAGHMLGNPSHARVVPELHQIRITSAGEVGVSGGAGAGEPVRRLGQLLQATLGQSDPPVQLRLVISQATAPTPTFDSIREFDDALGYFERPDRPGVLRGLYARAASRPGGQDAVAIPTLDSVAPLVNREGIPSPEPASGAASKRRSMAVGAVALSILILCGFAVQYYRANGDSVAATGVGAMVGRAVAAVGDAVQAGVSAVSVRVGLGRLVWSGSDRAESAPAGATEKPSSLPAEVRRAERTRPSGESPSGEFRRQSEASPSNEAQQPMLAFDLDPTSRALAASDDATDAGASAAAQPVDASADDRDLPDALTVYSPQSAEVVPPVGIRPQLPRELPPNMRREDLLSIEVTVLSDGTVDSVKLLGEIRNVHDLMWLSAVKAWQFRPALKDGHPVKYRKTVWIAPQP